MTTLAGRTPGLVSPESYKEVEKFLGSEPQAHGEAETGYVTILETEETKGSRLVLESWLSGQKASNRHTSDPTSTPLATGKTKRNASKERMQWRYKSGPAPNNRTLRTADNEAGGTS